MVDTRGIEPRLNRLSDEPSQPVMLMSMMVRKPRIELGSFVYQTNVLTIVLHAVAQREGIEPPSLGLESKVMPLYDLCMLVLLRGIEPRYPAYQAGGIPLSESSIIISY